MTSIVQIPFELPQNSHVFSFNFYQNGNPLEHAPRCFFSLKEAGSMAFDWFRENQNRVIVFKSAGVDPDCVAPVKLIHSRIVYQVELSNPKKVQQYMYGKAGDGIITKNPRIIPSVTGADCLTVYLYDTVSGARGVVHSGWKGTGIAVDAVARMERLYETNAGNICAVLGPHIRSCCYEVDEARAEKFASHFGSETVLQKLNATGETVYYLSLRKANLALLKSIGVTNIAYVDVCTCCNLHFGSYRREGSSSFTRCAAFIM